MARRPLPLKFAVQGCTLFAPLEGVAAGLLVPPPCALVRCFFLSQGPDFRVFMSGHGLPS